MTTKKFGGSFRKDSTVWDFLECIQNCGSTESKFVGPPFTWCNKQHGRRHILEHLDRVLVSLDWLNDHPRALVFRELRIALDHCSLLLDFDRLLKGGLSHLNLRDFGSKWIGIEKQLREAWMKYFEGNPILKVFHKLKHVKQS